MCCSFSLCEKCPKGIDVGVTPSGPSCPPTLLDEMEDRRQRDKEKQVSPIYPWDHKCRIDRETVEQSQKFIPLHEAPTRRNNQSMSVNRLFSYQEILWIKEHLGDYLEDTEKYSRAFNSVALLYDIIWKDVMYILGQTLTPDTKSRALGKVVPNGDECLCNESVGKGEDEITSLPTGNQVLPTTETDWEYNTAKGRCNQNNFVTCILFFFPLFLLVEGVLRWTLGCTCPFHIWFPHCVCPEMVLLDHMAVLFPVF